MSIFKCKMCGGNLAVTGASSIVTCEYCGTNQTISKTRDEAVSNLYNRANDLRIKCEFDRAEQTYEKILEQDNTEAEAHWGIVLCRYGIEYVEDPATKKMIPTCHRTSYEAITSDTDYIAAIENADQEQQALYKAEAAKIDIIQKDILAIVKNEEPFDVFICYKETDENGKRTVDSAIANDIYYQLTQEGFKVFYAPITLEDKLGQEYEPYIFAALNSAKVMLVVGTKPEHFNAVWVRNEWSRYLKLMKTDRSKLLVPCYKDMDAYDLPDEFAHLQSQDMGKIGFITDVVRGIKKIVTKLPHQEINIKAHEDNRQSKFLVEEKRNIVATKFNIYEKIMLIISSVCMFLFSASDIFDGLISPLTLIRCFFVIASIVFIITGAFGKTASKSFLVSQPIFWVSIFLPQALGAAADERYELANIGIFAASILTIPFILSKFFGKDGVVIRALKILSTISFVLGFFISVLLAFEWGIDRKDMAYVVYLISGVLTSVFVALGTFINSNKLNNINRKQKATISQIEKARIAKRNKKIALITSPIVAVIIAVVILLTTVIIPNNKYNNAISLLESGNIVEAYEALIALDDYKDSSEKAKSIYNEFKIEKLKISNVKKGDYLFFGAYEQDNNTSNGKEDIEWLVLEVKDGKALIISKHAIDGKPYNTSGGKVMWETCTLRKWLNSDFLNSAFTEDEKTKIPTVLVSADKNPEFNSDPGSDTQDKVFLLSITEAYKYFDSDKSRICYPTAYAVKNGTTKSNIDSCGWWLRTPGEAPVEFGQQYEALVYEQGDVINSGTNDYYDHHAVRPVIWIELNP